MRRCCTRTRTSTTSITSMSTGRRTLRASPTPMSMLTRRSRTRTRITPTRTTAMAIRTGEARPANAGDVLDFWFGTGAARGRARPEWYRKDARFDEEIRSRFGALLEAAARGELESWRAAPESMLALVIVLDQFSRNLFRGDARAFAQDAHALECAREALARGDEAVLSPVERQFLYMPFEHSERLADQERAVERMASLDAYEETK